MNLTRSQTRPCDFIEPPKVRRSHRRKRRRNCYITNKKKIRHNIVSKNNERILPHFWNYISLFQEETIITYKTEKGLNLQNWLKMLFCLSMRRTTTKYFSLIFRVISNKSKDFIYNLTLFLITLNVMDAHVCLDISLSLSWTV